MLLRTLGAGLVFAAVACASGGAVQQTTTPAPQQTQRPGVYPHSDADIEFMSGMIPHHAQAVLIGNWVAARSERRDIRVLAERIVVSQRDEIAMMQTWLSDRGLPMPPADATHHRMKMNGVEHDMLMPGMLSAAELAQLEKARGAEFDRLFLTFMIRHHEGALKMVDDLFASYGAAQEETVFRFASDVYADQTTEIEFMTRMLVEGK
ncbi:MAG TPA: DUF305 domain-containing protein [Vicinamibacterales bacterium]|nr:DUF305 domain-containing protein [Vicinamibacterales bacterium]